MKLSELSEEYRAEALAIRNRILELQERLNRTDDPVEFHSLRRRITELRPLLRQCIELAAFTKNYYNGGYCRDPKYTI